MKFVNFYEKIVLSMSYRDKYDNFKNVLIFMMAIKKLFSPGKKFLFWLYPSLGLRFNVGQDSKYYERIHNENYSVYLESCLKAVMYAVPDHKTKICDLGCGTGDLVKKLREMGYDAEGYESSPNALNKKVSNHVFKLDESLFSKKFDIVCLFSVVEHIEKEEISNFLSKIYNISSDWVICSIPVYPNSIRDFYDDPTHRIFERPSFWDEVFEKAGFYKAYVPAEILPFINTMIYRKKKKTVNKIFNISGPNLVRMRMSIGDNLCVLPSLELIKQKFKDISLYLSEDSTYKDILSLSPVFSGISDRAMSGVNIVEFHFARDLSVHLNREFANQAGLDEVDLPMAELRLSKEDEIDFDLSLPCLAVDTRSGWASRLWPFENFEKTCRILKESFKIKIIEIGRYSKYWMVNGTCGFDKRRSRELRLSYADIDFTNRLTLRQTAWIISKCGFFLGNDSGLAHIAALVKAKSFVLYGPAESKLRAYNGFTFPFFDTECYGCYTKGIYREPELKKGCPLRHHKCMRKIKPDTVAMKIAEVMNLERIAF